MSMLIQLFEGMWDDEEEAQYSYPNPIHGVPPEAELKKVWDEVEELELAIVDLRLERAGMTKFDPKKYADMVRQVRWEFGEVTGVPLVSIVPSERMLDPEYLARLVKGAESVEASSKLPVVYRHNKRNFLADGNHRAAAEYMKGKRYFKALYIPTRNYAEWLEANAQ